LSFAALANASKNIAKPKNKMLNLVFIKYSSV
jgi:hypothetical protein